jgi:uncharacterized Fe-S cluster-containing protein
MTEPFEIKLPGLDCGMCGYSTCAALAAQLQDHPDLLKRCIPLSADSMTVQSAAVQTSARIENPCISCPVDPQKTKTQASTWRDSLDREFYFYLERFPEDPGPREIILPHNPMLTRELDIHPGDVLIGRPLGLSCGCPVSHCGIAMQVDHRTGVMTWCITGPLTPRQQGYKDLGYYAAEAYEGIISESRCEIKIGMRYFFQPRTCMLQWRHSGLVNYINKTAEGLQVQVEGLWIG